MDKLPIKQRQKDKLTERQPFQHKHTATQFSCYMLCEDKKIFFRLKGRTLMRKAQTKSNRAGEVTSIEGKWFQ